MTTRARWLDGHESQSSFEFFCAVTVPELSRFFGRAFWRSLPSASQQFPPVGSALLAVASLHRRYKELGDSNSYRAAGKPGPDKFAVVHYGKALRQIIHDMAKGDRARPHCRLMYLVCGVLFIIVEVLQGDNRKALAHLDGAIALLEEPRDTTTAGQLLMTDLEQELRPIISRFDVEASIFSTKRPPRLTLPPLASLDQDGDARIRLFPLDQAAHELNNLIAHVLHFKRTRANTLRYETGGDIPPEALQTQQQLAAHFQRWWQSAAAPLSAISPLVDPERFTRATLLRIQYHAMWTMLKCCLNAEETDYDRYLDVFSELVRLVGLLVETHHHQWAISTSTGMTSRSFSPETGIVFPLYWTCLRCRDGRVRRTALHLLRKCSQEGVWIPEIHARVAERAMEVEGGGVSRESSLSLEDTDELPFPSCTDVYEFRRIHCVGLDVDEPRQVVRMTYHRRLNGPDGGWNVDQEWLYYGN